MAAERTVSLNDHACLAYSSRSERDAAAVDWLVVGVRLGQRVVAVTADDDEGARLMGSIGAALHQDVAHFALDQLYDLSRPIDRDAQLALYADQVTRVVDDGFTGIRVFCDITLLIADPARRLGHARWEHFADAWMAKGNPLAPLCAYDVNVVGDQCQGLVALHPLRHTPEANLAQFGLYCGPSGPVLDGEIDTFNVTALTEALRALPEGPVDLDASGLSFLCARGASTMAQAGRTANGQPRLRLIAPRPIVRRVWEALDLDARMLAPSA